MIKYNVDPDRLRARLNAAPRGTLQRIEADTRAGDPYPVGLSYSWLTKFAGGRMTNPGYLQLLSVAMWLRENGSKRKPALNPTPQPQAAADFPPGW